MHVPKMSRGGHVGRHANPFLLLTAILITSVAFTAQAQPPSSLNPENRPITGRAGAARPGAANAFIRSDQYNFIRHGVPALAMGVGFEKGSPQQELFKTWRTQRYHAPSDDLEQPVDLAAARKYEDIIHGLMVRLVDSEGRPQWKQDSFFRRYAPIGLY
ncbi:MAG: M28 family peptidase [Candidatus Angelobacter sp.]